ncbi:putative protein N(5)-glutamine methyltransferase [Nocardioides zeicaulis]|uniref:Methyltransferase small domain-containing protein n=1 Tax=Nocardioides zeicaulis TaxID=1776857 RepID=A0ABV6DW41_9ACTN
MTAHDEVVARLRAAGCVWAEEEAALLAEAATGEALARLVERRVAGEPLETVLGWVLVLGHRLSVTRGVFVPRRRTELLVRAAQERARLATGSRRPVVVEMCCGAGPVAALLEGYDVEVHAADVSPPALACAGANAPSAALHLGDLWDALPAGLAGRVDVVAANAPYVPTARIATMPAEARDHEPLEALDGGTDGVHLHRRLAAGAPVWLAPGGVLLVETSLEQLPLTHAAMEAAGLATDVLVDDEVQGCVAVGVAPGVSPAAGERG